MKKRLYLFVLVGLLLVSFSSSVFAQAEMIADPAEFLAKLDYERAAADLAVLVNDIGPRLAGTKAELPAIQYIYDQLAAIDGYEVSLQDFTLNSNTSADVILDDKVYSSITPTNNAFYSGWGTVAGEPLFVNDPALLPDDSDFSDEIVFFPGNLRSSTDRSTGVTTYIDPETYDNVKLLSEYDAAGIVVVFDYTMEEDERFQIRCYGPNLNADNFPVEEYPDGFPTPLAVLNRFGYEDIMDNIGDIAENEISLGDSATISTRPFVASQNIIALKKAEIPTEKTIYVTSHYDSKIASPGANDNGSGVVMMLAMARAFADVPTDYNIAFISFGAEEIGLKGARYFVSKLSPEQIANAVGNYNMDMIATSQEDCQYIFMNSSVDENAAVDAPELETSVTKMARLAAQMLDFDMDYYHTVYDTTTDHYAFHEVGIPAVEFDWRANAEGTSFEAYYHTYFDDIEHNFSLERLQLQGDIISLAVYMEATALSSADGILREEVPSTIQTP